MFPQFASTARSITRATALITRVGTDANLYDDPETEDFMVLLDSKFEAEKVEGMKRLIALMSQGKDVSNFFPQVLSYSDSIFRDCDQKL
jgi:AP-3 complex subunit beta